MVVEAPLKTRRYHTCYGIHRALLPDDQLTVEPLVIVANELAEGQIIAQDIETVASVQLVRKGTYLTESMIACLKEIFVESETGKAVWTGELDE